MTKQRVTFVLLFVLLFITANVSAYDNKLRDDFQNPPREYSLFPFWAWNDTLEEEKLKWQIDQMVEKGVYGAFIHARVGINKGETPYFSPGWWEAVDTAVTYGKKVGFYPWLYDEDKWPSGSAGGRTAAVNPEEFTQKGLKYSKMEIEGPQNINLPLVDNLVGIIAAKLVSEGVIEPGSLIDITNFSGKQWYVPEGRWLIISFRQIKEEIIDYARAIDYLDKEAVAAFIKITHEEYYRRYGEHFGDLIRGIFFDEISAKLPGADFAWTDDFLEKFEEIKGYDLKKYLPLLVYDGGEKTPKIRCDYYDVFTSLYTDAWFKQIADWCGEHNISLMGHTYEDIFSYVTQGDYFRTLGQLQMPLTDNESFRYSFPRYIEWYKPKQLTSIASLNDRKYAAVEALGGSGWAYTLDELRYGISMLGVHGLNFMVLHGLFYTTDTPWAAMDFPPSWFYQNPYWKYFGQAAKFAQRVLYMGSRGRHVCDTAILFPITSQWASPRREGGGLGKKYTIDEFDDILSFQYYNVQELLLANQIDYEIIDPASLLKSDVSAGKIKIAQQAYSVLILPPLTVVKRDVLEKIKSFYENGGTVIALNTLPVSSMEQGRRDPVVINAVNDIFGFNPFFLRSGYFETNKTYTRRFVKNVSAKNGTAYFTKKLADVPEMVEAAAGRDIIIRRGDPVEFHFLHRVVGDCDIYYFMNGQKVARELTVSFRCAGTAEKWDPETGQIERIYAHKAGDGRTEATLSFKPWESYYVVFDKSRMVGQGPPYTNKWAREKSLPEINLDGQWDFIPVGKILDYKWQSTVKNSQIKLPVMDFYPERVADSVTMKDLLGDDCEDVYWKQVKIKDSRNTTTGCGRYLSCWDGWWITYTDFKPHWGTVGGRQIKFRKKITIDDAIKGAALNITADKKYKLYINNKIIGEDDDWGNAEIYEIAKYLKTGENLFEISVKDAGGLLLQADIVLENGRDIKLVSDGTWEVSNEGGIWGKAFEYVNPPLGPWGNIELKKQPLSFPVDVWYRQELPAGAVGMTAPLIKGDFQIFVNGRTVESVRGQERIVFKKLLNSKKNILLVKVNVKDYSEGIIEPISVICEPAKVELDLWEDYGLDWYSGRCVYSKEFVVADEYLAGDTKLVLDLGQVNYFVEVWVNDKLVGYKIWPPYEFEIQDFVKPGGNSISLVVANLITNEMMWNLFDESLTVPRARWVQDLGILREPEKLASGVVGPVKIVPFKVRKIEIQM